MAKFDDNELSGDLEKKLSDIRTKETETKYMQAAQEHGLNFLNIKKTPISTDALGMLDEATARHSNMAVILKRGNTLTVAVTDPENPETIKAIKDLEKKKFTIQKVMTTPEGLDEAFSRYSLIPKKEVFELGAIEINEEELEKFEAQIKDVEDLKQKIKTIAVTKILDILIAGALKTGASDIHFEPSKESAKIRYRFDGILHDVTLIDRSYYDKIINRVKIVSKMKINIHNSPQDGRFTIRQKNVDIEVRVSILPSEFGETAVMRLLDPRSINQKLETLGIRADLLELIRTQLRRPNGAIITTGPTGSGKTTALYSFIIDIQDSESKIITIEDPIEYHVDGISQTQVDNSKGYTFANGLRAIVRQDPDVILVGEIRDKETADIALNASLTGHLVLTTLHTNDSAGAIPRLIDLGIKPEVIAPAINLVLAQRLLRKLCSNCRKETSLPKEKVEKIKDVLAPIKERYKISTITEKTKIYEPAGCVQCNNAGYKGRIATFEGFAIGKEMEQVIMEKSTISAIRELAIKEGLVTMLQDSYMKLLEGTTSLDEIERVVG